MTDKEILKALGLSKKSCVSEQIVQTTHHWLDACEKIADLEKENAGLKASRPKWHKVADGDLPKETGEYLTNIGVLIWDYYADGRYGWHTPFCEACDCCDNVDSDEVVAWCEIPEYTEE